MTKLHGSYLAGFGSPWIKHRLQICRVANYATRLGPAQRICIHVCICVCVLKCVRAERACVYVGDGRTDWMEGLVNLNVYMCVRA